MTRETTRRPTRRTARADIANMMTAARVDLIRDAIGERMDRLREIAAELRMPDANNYRLSVHIERIANEISKPKEGE